MTKQDEYKQKLTESSNHCPHCGSDNLDMGDYDGDGSMMWFKVECLDCSMEWKEEYRFVNFCGLQIPEEE